MLRPEFSEAFRKVDVCICLILPFMATKVGAMKVAIENGVEVDMLFVIMQFTSMQIIDWLFDEAILFRIGSAFQPATDCHRRAPKL
ncbi:MAG TPA: hypothetical protein VEW72_07675 [Burkholderiales bacterium]|nr:hypothetical protein [Burkholderiales bacterium]